MSEAGDELVAVCLWAVVVGSDGHVQLVLLGVVADAVAVGHHGAKLEDHGILGGHLRGQGMCEKLFLKNYILKDLYHHCILIEHYDLNFKKNKHNAELQRADPGTKVAGLFSTRGRIFPHNAQNGFLLFSSF